MHSHADFASLIGDLQQSSLPIAGRILELAQSETLNVSLIEQIGYAEAVEVLSNRASVKATQRAAAHSEVSRSRLQTIETAIASIVSWWGLHPDLPVKHVNLQAAPDIVFVLWFRADNGALVAGFESRDATKLTAQRASDFYGEDRPV